MHALPAEALLTAADGVRVSASRMPAYGSADGRCFVVVHGFTGHWRQPRVQRVVDGLRAFGDVIAIDMRGHGRSSGMTTMGMDETLDVDAAVAWARRLGYVSVVTVGFSMGGAVCVRHAAFGAHRPDAVVAVSAPAFWYYRGTAIMRRVHMLIESPRGRAIVRATRGTRVSGQEWPTPPPPSPVEAAARIEVPFLVVHGDADHYFPVEHAKALQRAAEEGVCPHVGLVVVPGMAHAESAVSAETIAEIGAWSVDALNAHADGDA